MCGINGIFQSSSPEIPAEGRLRAMAEAMAHRGPDGMGLHVEPHLGLGHRRLSIVDLAGGAQPMSTTDGRLTISFNGEIYNFATLRRRLEAAGHQFRTRSDTEAILHAWREYGVAALDELQGMFAFALWDAGRGELLLARDRLGEKPLHYAWLPDGSLAFASEIAGLLALPEVSRRPDPAAIEDFLALGYIPDPATAYAAIRRLPAGHFLLLRRGEAGRPEPRAYWSAPTSPARGVDAAQAPAALRARLDAAVRAQLMSDVPLGAFLSGGVDSASVVSLAAAARREEGGAPLDAFTIGFPGAGDERPMAAAVAARVGAAHHQEAGTTDYLGAARGIAALFGEPFGDHSAVPTLAVCRLARRHVTVALSGDGGDEVFAGYRRHRFHALAEAARAFLPAPVRRGVVARLAALYPRLDRAPRWLRAKSTLTELGLDSAMGYYSMACKLEGARRHALYAPGFRAALDGHDPAARFAAAIGACDPDAPLQAAQYADVTTYLPGDILVKTDRTAMAVSLELRAPFLDHGLVEWGMALPASLKLQRGVGKHVLRRAMAADLPAELLWGAKRGFADDIAAEFRARAPELRARLAGPAMLDSGMFDRTALLRLADEHASGRFDHAQPLWQLLVLEGWLAQAPAAPTLPAAAMA
ncbi:asparagine synthase (glutamine-hydrolyzing) [Roseococcus sp. DSY-14]|uniref:asparagine synthase (glutamine-hydrolyzing) n=1 Tax=Roseococcus sp. DSY-14 TaxID=3369650 RepID=UPI00387B6428